MAVREFNGSSDQLVCAIGAASGMTFGTFACIVKINNGGTDRALGHLHNSGGTWLASPSQLTSGNTWGMHDGTTSSDSGIAVSTGVWYLVVMRKATGAAAPRFSSYNFNTTTWTHAAGTNENNWTAPGSGGTIQFSFQNGSGDFLDGRVAARALWSNTLPWTADAAGDTAIQSAGLHTAASNWASNNPTAFWRFNQASTATPVPDDSTAGTAGQSSISGTTVINGDDPPGFDFSLGATPTVTVPLQRWPSTVLGRWPRPQQPVIAETPAITATNAPADVATATGTAPFDSAGGSISLNLIADNPVEAVGTAYDATVSTAPHTNAAAGLASATGTANGATVKVAPSPSTATATGTANNPTVQTGSFTNASAGLASATATANDATVKVAPGSGVATAIGAAQGATGAVSPTPSAASGTGTANTTTSKVATGPGTATAAGTADNAVVNTGGNVNAAAGLASATGTAFNATVTRTANAQAGVASATGTVPLVSLRIAAQIQAAQALAEAFGVIPNQVLVGTAHAAAGAAPTASAASMTVPTATGA